MTTVTINNTQQTVTIATQGTQGPPGPSGGGGGSVDSVNGNLPDSGGDVTLTAGDVGAQVGIQFKDETTDVGGLGSVAAVNFAGAGVTATFDAGVLTVTIPGGGGGSSAWGGITGTLSAQTDLQSALDAKANTSALAAVATSGAYADLSGKPTLGTAAATAATDYATAAQGALADSALQPNAAITGATKTKITYDADGLVTAGADATTADIADSSNKRYVTDAQLTVIGNTSNVNTGDQTITLTGNVTGSGTGSFAATIANDAVTYAKMQNVSAASKLLGRGDGGSGDVEEITVGSGLAMTGTTLSAAGGGGSGDFVGPASSTDNAIVRFDSTTGKLGQNSALIIGDVSGSSLPVSTTAGNAIAISATSPAAITTAQAGVAASIAAGAAVAGSSVAGAAAGGSVTITAGAAARLTSGNANGGDIVLTPGAGIGTGTAGQVVSVAGTAAAPTYSFSGDPDTGFYNFTTNTIGFSAGGTNRVYISNAEFQTTVPLRGNGAGTSIEAFKTLVSNRTSDAAESGTTSYTVVTNAGATALVTRTLPTAAAGLMYTFICLGTDGLRITAFTGDDIRVIDKITATAGYIQSTTIGSVVTLVAVDATTWVATAIHGVWGDGTFTYDDSGLTTP